jgi:hypothetical protein
VSLVFSLIQGKALKNVDPIYGVDFVNPDAKFEQQSCVRSSAIAGAGTVINWSEYFDPTLLAALGGRDSITTTCKIPAKCVAGVLYVKFESTVPSERAMEQVESCKYGILGKIKPSPSIGVNPMIAGVNPYFEYHDVKHLKLKATNYQYWVKHTIEDAYHMFVVSFVTNCDKL